MKHSKAVRILITGIVLLVSIVMCGNVFSKEKKEKKKSKKAGAEIKTEESRSSRGGAQGSGYISLFSDKRIRKGGDLITVMIMESSLASKEVSSDISRETTNSLGADLAISGSNNKKYSAGIGAGSKAKGEANIERRGSLVGMITVRITDVMPDGNLVLKGNQTTLINKEAQVIHVFGIARPEDIDSNNTIISSKLANADIRFVGKKEPKVHGQGIISKILRIIF